MLACPPCIQGHLSTHRVEFLIFKIKFQTAFKKRLVIIKLSPNLLYVCVLMSSKIKGPMIYLNMSKRLAVEYISQSNSHRIFFNMPTYYIWLISSPYSPPPVCNHTLLAWITPPSLLLDAYILNPICTGGGVLLLVVKKARYK